MPEFEFRRLVDDDLGDLVCWMGHLQLHAGPMEPAGVRALSRDRVYGAAHAVRVRI